MKLLHALSLLNLELNLYYAALTEMWESAGSKVAAYGSPSKQKLCSPAKSAARRQVSCLAADTGQAQDECLGAAGPIRRPGELHLIMGPMFAGKTTALLQMVSEAEAAKERVTVITNALDTRYGTNQCVTHTGKARDAIAVRHLNHLLHPKHCVSGWNLDSFDVIAIDESQFFPDLKEFCLHAVEEQGKTVIAAGLSGDFQRDIFGDIVNLVPFADSVHFLRARCTFCEEPASFTLRLVASDKQQLVGGKDAYQPVCRHHYRRLHRGGGE
jgi:thymidine kinase